MSQDIILKFDVFYFWCEQMRPTPKNKFVVVMYSCTEYALGFVINSRITEYVSNRKDLLTCYAALDQLDHSNFLTHNSFVDCSSPYTFTLENFSESSKCGSLSESARINVLEAVRKCKILKPKHKNLILEIT